jgi:hypothetical protein
MFFDVLDSFFDLLTVISAKRKNLKTELSILFLFIILLLGMPSIAHLSRPFVIIPILFGTGFILSFLILFILFKSNLLNVPLKMSVLIGIFCYCGVLAIPTGSMITEYIVTKQYQTDVQLKLKEDFAN